MIEMSGFDFFDEPEASSTASPLAEVARVLGEEPNIHDASRYLKPRALSMLATPAVWHFFKNKAWAVEVKPGVDAESAAIVMFKDLFPKGKLSASDHYLYDLTLYVLHRGGALIKKPEPKTKVDKGPTLSDVKHKLLRAAANVFGETAVSLVGSEDKGYRMVIVPKGKLAGKFRRGEISAKTLGELGLKLDEVLDKAKVFG